MPSGLRWSARAKQLIQHYVLAKKAQEKCLQCRKAKLCQIFQHANQVIGHVNSPASLSSLSNMSTSSDSGEGEDSLDRQLEHASGLCDTELPELTSFGTLAASVTV